MDSTSTVLNYNATSSGDISDGKSFQHQSQQTYHRVNGHAQQIPGCTMISINPNTNNNSSSSFKQAPSTITTSTGTLTTSNAASSNGVLHLIPSSSLAAQPVFVLDDASQQKLLSFLVAGSGGGCGGGGVAMCSLAADANVLVAAMNDQLQQQSNTEVQVSESVLCRNESSTCNSMQEDLIVGDQASSSGDKIDNTRGFAHERDMGRGFQNAETFNTDPLMFLANAAEEVKAMMEIGDDISTNEEGHDRQRMHLRSIGTCTNACNYSISAKEKQYPPQNSAKKEINVTRIQEQSTDSLLSLVSAISQAPSLSNTEKQKEKSLQNNELPALETITIPSLEEVGEMASMDALTEAKLVDEGLMSLLQKAVDLEGTQSEQFTPGEENLMEYCLKMVDQQMTSSSGPEDAQSADLPVVDEFRLGNVNEDVVTEVVPSAPVIDGAIKIEGREENAMSADLAVVCKDQQAEGNETTELELPSAPFNGDVHVLDSLEVNAQSADSVVISTVTAPEPPCPASPGDDARNKNAHSADYATQLLEVDKNGESPSSLSSHEAGPCPFDLTSLTSDEAQCSQSGSPVPDGGLKNQSLVMHDDEREKSSTHSIASQGLSSNILSDLNVGTSEEDSDIHVPADTAPLPITTPQTQVSNTLNSEDDCKTNTEARNFCHDEEDLGVDAEQQLVQVDQCSPSENRNNRVCIQIRVNISPPISNSDMNAKLSEKESKEPPTIHAPLSPMLPQPLLSTASTTQSQLAPTSLVEQYPAAGEEQALTSDTVEMDAQSGVNCIKEVTDLLHYAESMESTIPLSADHELKTQVISSENNKGSEEREHRVTGSTDVQSMESDDACVPLIPELQSPFHFVKEQYHSDDVEETGDCNGSSHTTKSTDTHTHLSQSDESANCMDSELVVPFREHPLSSDHNNGRVDDRNAENQPTESACHCAAQTVADGAPTVHSTSTDILPANACLELKDDRKHEHSIDVDLPPTSDLTTEVCDQIEDDRLSSTSGIITTSACFRKEWSDTNSDTQSSSTTGFLSRSGSYSLNDSFSSCDQCSLGDSTRSGVSDSVSERVHRDKSSDEKFVERPSSLSSSSFKRKKACDSGFYAATKVIMTRSKFADLRRIGDDFTISQALTSPFHDISGDSFGSGSPDDEECPSKIASHQLGRSLSVSSVESASSVGSLDNSGR